jgi:ATP-dependent Clp protease protease subunit
MIHQPLGRLRRAMASDIEIQAREILYLRERLNKIMSECTGQPLERIEKDTDRDNFMSPKAAVSYGLIDKVMAQPRGRLGLPGAFRRVPHRQGSKD